MMFVYKQKAAYEMIWCLEFRRVLFRCRGRTNYMIDSGAHSAPPNGASGGSDLAINMSPLRGEIDCSTTAANRTFATEGHERKLCQNNKILRTCYAEEHL